MAITPVTTGMLSVDGFEADEVLPDIERPADARRADGGVLTCFVITACSRRRVTASATSIRHSLRGFDDVRFGPIADKLGYIRIVRFVPIADVAPLIRSPRRLALAATMGLSVRAP
jgi:hypothetical protein